MFQNSLFKRCKCRTHCLGKSLQQMYQITSDQVQERKKSEAGDCDQDRWGGSSRSLCCFCPLIWSGNRFTIHWIIVLIEKGNQQQRKRYKHQSIIMYRKKRCEFLVESRRENRAQPQLREALSNEESTKKSPSLTIDNFDLVLK